MNDFSSWILYEGLISVEIHKHASLSHSQTSTPESPRGETFLVFYTQRTMFVEKSVKLHSVVYQLLKLNLLIRFDDTSKKILLVQQNSLVQNQQNSIVFQ